MILSMIDLFLANLWRWKCGVEEITPQPIPDLISLRESEWSVKFETLMRNRLVMGAIRYGRINTHRPAYDRMKSIDSRLTSYKLTGNDELLVDIANLCLLEFVEGKHPLKHFKAYDDAEHVAAK